MSNEERRLSGLTATFLVVASMVGTGVFTTSGLLLAIITICEKVEALSN